MLRRNSAELRVPITEFGLPPALSNHRDETKKSFKEDVYDRSQFSEMSNLWSQTS
jgi:hypothetical protein